MSLLDLIVLAVAVTAAGIPASAHAATGEVLVDARQFQCLIKQIDSIPREPRGVYVDISDCIRRGPSIHRAFVAPRMPPVDGLDAILLVTPDRLTCARRHRRNIAAIVEARPQARYRLRWEPCPAR